MRLINFISLYQYFDNLCSNYSYRINYLSSKNAKYLTDHELKELYELRAKYQLILKIERELSEFIIDL